MLFLSTSEYILYMDIRRYISNGHHYICKLVTTTILLLLVESEQSGKMTNVVFEYLRIYIIYGYTALYK